MANTHLGTVLLVVKKIIHAKRISHLRLMSQPGDFLKTSLDFL
jgi:hypothetical protein